MKLVITTESSEEMISLEISPNSEFSMLKILISADTNITVEKLKISKDGAMLNYPDTTTLSSMGLVDNDVLVAIEAIDPNAGRTRATPVPTNPTGSIDFSSIDLTRIMGQSASASLSSSPGQSSRNAGIPVNRRPEVLQQLAQMLGDPNTMAQIRTMDPELAEAMSDPTKFLQLYERRLEQNQKNESELNQLETRDQFDPAVQLRIAELIKQKNINQQLEAAMEHNPESFAQTTMLYVRCYINGNPVLGFVDSGAQMTFISSSLATKCNLDRLVDTRWQGEARGVGVQKIRGRVHAIQVEIGSVFIQTSVSILDNQEVDMLIGLDMLKRFQCKINLKDNQLELTSVNAVTPFLPENELPKYARLNRAPQSPGEAASSSSLTSPSGENVNEKSSPSKKK